MKADLRPLLVSFPAITDAVGQAISWGNFPQGVGDPAVRLSYVVGVEGMHMQGPDGLTRTTVQASIRGEIVSEVWSVASALKAINGYSATFGGTYFDKIEVNERGSSPEETPTSSYYLHVVDLEIWHRDAT